ncbi:MAG: CHASE2 domain-containing protein [Kovacikia sp.]
MGLIRLCPIAAACQSSPPPDIPPDQVGFVDTLLDEDGKLRRSLLGTSDPRGVYRLSWSIKLAAAYLKPRGFELENGIQDPVAMRFGTTELTRFQPNTGGYVRADAGGNQILINFRSGRHPFRILTLQALQTGVNPDWLCGKIVVIGVMAPSVKDIISSTAIDAENPALIYGVEAQAHMVSQIVSATLDGRPLLNAWAKGWEYLWMIAWGVLGILLGRGIRSPLKSLFWIGVASLGLIGSGYWLLLLGWWIPVVPPLLMLLLNGAGLSAFYRYDEILRLRVQERQAIIDQTFNAIHNGPLQTLAQLLRQVQTEELLPSQFLTELQQLNRELRGVYDAVRQEAVAQRESLYLEQDHELDLQTPLHEILYSVYIRVLERNLPHLKPIKVKVVTFEPFDERRLTLDQKRGVCRFLEEALCNVGKHAVGATRLEICCALVEGQNRIRIVDNGVGCQPGRSLPSSQGMGTQQANNLARQMGGRFQRVPNSPKGTICELTWSTRRVLRWQFWW